MAAAIGRPMPNISSIRPEGDVATPICAYTHMCLHPCMPAPIRAYAQMCPCPHVSKSLGAYCSLSVLDGLIGLISGNLRAYQASRWDDLGCQSPGLKSIIFQMRARVQRVVLAASSRVRVHIRRAKICTEDVFKSAHKTC